MTTAFIPDFAKALIEDRSRSSPDDTVNNGLWRYRGLVIAKKIDGDIWISDSHRRCSAVKNRLNRLLTTMGVPDYRVYRINDEWYWRNRERLPKNRFMKVFDEDNN